MIVVVSSLFLQLEVIHSIDFTRLLGSCAVRNQGHGLFSVAVHSVVVVVGWNGIDLNGNNISIKITTIFY